MARSRLPGWKSSFQTRTSQEAKQSQPDPLTKTNLARHNQETPPGFFPSNSQGAVYGCSDCDCLRARLEGPHVEKKAGYQVKDRKVYMRCLGKAEAIAAAFHRATRYEGFGTSAGLEAWATYLAKRMFMEQDIEDLAESMGLDRDIFDIK